MNMTKTFTIISVILASLLFVSFPVSAAYFSVPYHRNSQSSFNGFDSFSANADAFSTRDNSFFDSSNFNERNAFGNSNSFFGEGFFDSNFGSFSQQGVAQSADGFNFVKSPCATRTVQAHFSGRGNDFTIVEEICDGIEGDFYRSNNFDNRINNNVGYNQQSFGANAAQSNNGFDDFSRNSEDVRRDSQRNAFGYTVGQETSFGKGSQIIFG